MRTELCRLLRNPDVLGVALRAEVRFCGRAPMCIKGIATDSREVCAGDLFVALMGEHTDGVLHIGEALRRGAGGLLVPTGTPLPAGDLVAYFVPSVMADNGAIVYFTSDADDVFWDEFCEKKFVVV